MKVDFLAEVTTRDSLFGKSAAGPELTRAWHRVFFMSAVRQRQPGFRFPRLFVAPSPIHGLGLFAGEAIEWGQRLIEFQGQRLSRKEVRRRQRFYDSIGFSCLMQFGDGVGVDGLLGGNESRFINHSTQPNVGALREDEWRIVFYALDDIARGEELTFNYGFEPRETLHESRGVAGEPAQRPSSRQIALQRERSETTP